MGRYPKGIEARQNIIRNSVEVFNEEGLGITIEQLASKLQLSRGSITNYFPTKDHLFVAIAEEYELALSDLIQTYDWGEGPINLTKLARYFSTLLDLQYHYRSAISFSMTAGPQQRIMLQHVTGTYPTRIEQMKRRIGQLIDAGILEPAVLEPANQMVFLVQYTTLLSSWVFNMGMLGSADDYTRNRPLFVHAALSCYLPFFTETARTEYTQLKAGDLAHLTGAHRVF